MLDQPSPSMRVYDIKLVQALHNINERLGGAPLPDSQFHKNPNKYTGNIELIKLTHY